MADSTTGRVGTVLAGLPRREAAALAVVGVMAAASHLVAPRVVPEFAVYARYATYLVAFSVWMVWFVDWLAVWLGKEPHPSEQELAEDDPGET